MSVEIDTNYDKSYEIETWDELDIPIDLLRGIYAYGFEKVSPIQKRAIKPMIQKKDIIAQAQSGTGKTATFTIGALANVDLKEENVQVVMLAPTRELSKQIATFIINISSMLEGLKVATLVGGTSIDQDITNLKNNTPHIIVGCPGRIHDMMRRNKYLFNKIKLVVLDEADELFSSGFKEQIYNIFQFFNKDAQVALFSATLPPYVNEIVNKISIPFDRKKEKEIRFNEVEEEIKNKIKSIHI